MTMTMTPPKPVTEMKPETIESLQELILALQDSSLYMDEASAAIRDDAMVSNTLKAIADERREICGDISACVAINDAKPAAGGTFLGTLRTIWTAFRAALNSGKPSVVLVEAERAEAVIVQTFKQILPEIVGNPINRRLLQHFETVKQGHDRVLRLKNAYQHG